MRFNVPQFIDIEDKVIGPLTLKQFMYLAVAGAIMFALWFAVEIWAFVVIGIPVFGVALAFTFYKVNGRPLISFVGAMINYYIKPKLYIWHQK